MACSVVECSELWNYIGSEGASVRPRPYRFTPCCDLPGTLSLYLGNEECWLAVCEEPLLVDSLGWPGLDSGHMTSASELSNLRLEGLLSKAHLWAGPPPI